MVEETKARAEKAKQKKSGGASGAPSSSDAGGDGEENAVSKLEPFDIEVDGEPKQPSAATPTSSTERRESSTEYAGIGAHNRELVAAGGQPSPGAVGPSAPTRRHGLF